MRTAIWHTPCWERKPQPKPERGPPGAMGSDGVIYPAPRPKTEKDQRADAAAWAYDRGYAQGYDLGGDPPEAEDGNEMHAHWNRGYLKGAADKAYEDARERGYKHGQKRGGEPPEGESEAYNEGFRAGATDKACPDEEAPAEEVSFEQSLLNRIEELKDDDLPK